MSQPQQMSMAGMGGPVGGGGGGPGQQQMNAGTPSNSATGNNSIEMVKKLNTYIYDYFLRNQHYEAARTMIEENLPLDTQIKQSPSQRQNQQPNGVDDLDTEMKDSQGIQKRPEDLPAPALQINEGPFLLDWWFQFWDIFNARRSAQGKPAALHYIREQRQMQKQRSQMAGSANPNMQNMHQQMNMMGAMSNGMIGGDLKKAAMQNQMTPQQQQQFMQLRAAQRNGQNVQQVMQGGSQMERQGSQMDMSGPRSGSPGSGDAPSPKRQRLDGNMQQQMGQRPGQPGQMQGNQVGPTSSIISSLDPAAAARTSELLRRNHVDPSTISQQQFVLLAEQPANHQQKSVEVYSQAMAQQMKQQAMGNASNGNKGMPPNAAAAMAQAGAQGSPMSQAGIIEGSMGDMYAANGGLRQLPPGVVAPPGTNGGQHALHDYQMQLMLLEHQNKKRLLLARQEQEGMTGAMPGQNGQFAPNMSPQGSRAGGPSPNPNEMQRGTPKPGNPGGSPGNMGGRGSPTPGFDPNQGIPPQMRGQMIAGPNGQIMRQAPSSHPLFNAQLNPAQQIEMFNRQQALMPNGTFQAGGPQQMPLGAMMPGQQQQPGQGPPNMTPRQGNQAMPPPPAPQVGNASGTQPSSPTQPPAPPTPSQTNKPKPGGKKENKASKKAAANKKGSAPTPASESSDQQQPPTSTPATPITPMNPQPFHPQQPKSHPNGSAPTQPPPLNQSQVQQNAVQQPGPPPQAPDMGTAFGNLGGVDGGDQFGLGNMEFAGLDGTDVLDNFDFDSFLNTESGDGGLAFDANFAFGDGGGGLEVEGGMPQ